MRHFEMAYATLFIETLILYTFRWHDQPHFVYGSMYFDIYLCNLSMDTWTLIYICVICLWIHVFWYIFFSFICTMIYILIYNSIVQFIVDHVYYSYLWNIIHFDHVFYIQFICNNFWITFYQPLLSNFMQCLIWNAIKYV